MPLAKPTCNALVMPASAPSVTEEIGTVPTVTGGGVIPSGTYLLIKRIIESGTPKTAKNVNVYDGTCAVGLRVDANGEVRSAGSFTASGNDLTVSITCPVTLVGSVTYKVDTTGAKAKLIVGEVGPATYSEYQQQ